MALALILFLALAQPAVITPASPVTAVRFSPDSQKLALAGGTIVRILAVGAKSPVRTLSVKLDQAFDVAWKPAPNGQGEETLAVAGGRPAQSGAVEFLDLDSGQSIARSPDFGDLVYGIDFSPDGRYLAAASGDGRIGIIEVQTGKQLATLEGHSGPVLCVAWSPDGSRLASGSADRAIRVWDTKSWKEERALTNHNGDVQSVVFTPDSSSLYSASSDATVRIWDPAIGRMKRIFRGCDRDVLGLAYAPQVHQLLAVSADGHARLMDADTGEFAKVFPRDSAPGAWLQAADVSPDSLWMAWADTDGQYRLLKFSP